MQLRLILGASGLTASVLGALALGGAAPPVDLSGIPNARAAEPGSPPLEGGPHGSDRILGAGVDRAARHLHKSEGAFDMSLVDHVGGAVTGVTSVDNTVYLATGLTVLVTDTRAWSDGQSTRIANRLAPRDGVIRAVDAAHDRLAVVDASRNLSVFDITEPTQPSPLASVPLPFQPKDVAVRDGSILVVGADASVVVELEGSSTRLIDFERSPGQLRRAIAHGDGWLALAEQTNQLIRIEMREGQPDVPQRLRLNCPVFDLAATARLGVVTCKEELLTIDVAAEVLAVKLRFGAEQVMTQAVGPATLGAVSADDESIMVGNTGWSFAVVDDVFSQPAIAEIPVENGSTPRIDQVRVLPGIRASHLVRTRGRTVIPEPNHRLLIVGSNAGSAFLPGTGRAAVLDDGRIAVASSWMTTVTDPEATVWPNVAHPSRGGSAERVWAHGRALLVAEHAFNASLGGTRFLVPHGSTRGMLEVSTLPAPIHDYDHAGPIGYLSFGLDGLVVMDWRDPEEEPVLLAEVDAFAGAVAALPDGAVFAGHPNEPPPPQGRSSHYVCRLRIQFPIAPVVTDCLHVGGVASIVRVAEYVVVATDGEFILLAVEGDHLRELNRRPRTGRSGHLAAIGSRVYLATDNEVQGRVDVLDVQDASLVEVGQIDLPAGAFPASIDARGRRVYVGTHIAGAIVFEDASAPTSTPPTTPPPPTATPTASSTPHGSGTPGTGSTLYLPDARNEG